MKKIVLYFFLLNPVLLWCQLHEKFDDNRNNWPSHADDAKRRIESGKFILETFGADNGKFVQMPHHFDPHEDFTMEASFIQRSGSDNNGIGLYWGAVSRVSKPYNRFIFTTNGYYMVSVTGQGEWVKTDLVKPMGEANILRVERKNDNVSCYLNGSRVANVEMKSYGFLAGFLNYTNMTLEVDYFDFDQNSQPIKLVESMPHGLTKENLGSNVNSTAEDLAPIISSDGKTLYFSREEFEGNIGGIKDIEDIWVSEFDGTGWGYAKNVGPPVNDEKANNMASVSADNNTLVFSGSDKFNFRKKTGSGWSDLIDAGIYFTNESANQESQLSSDGKAMLFSVKNSKNIYYNSAIDEKDIYVSLQDKNGTWSEAINLGPVINSPGDETSPFLSSDGRTLYFSSSGHPGYGGNDMFISKRLGDGWDKWSEPRNLGPEINTPFFDAYYTVPASGDYAYLVNNVNTIGMSDIFRIKLPKEVKPDPVVLLSGRALNAKTNKPVAAEILLDNLGTGKEVAEANSDPGTGQFKIILQPGANYGIHAAAKGYLSVNENMELASIHEYKEMQKDLLLMPIEVGLTLALNNVFFEQGKPTLRKESYPELDRLVKIMNDNPKMQIELGGYTDNVGSGGALMKLSQDRVDVVKKYLESRSISANRIMGRGYGATNPREKNDTEEHRKMNRRVEFKILKN
ncbi:MAG: OmpA family protein [Bacteroidetes bacterium]|nr:OmpA family protein [Bacteroidota bacterium]